MFILIDGILPFEACLYYQVLPLFLEGNRLNLGMVTPEDMAASEYVRRIVSYLNYSLVPRPISSEALQAALTAYLNHSGNQQASGKPRETVSYGHYRHSARARVKQQIDPDERRTLVVDSPEDLNSLEDNTKPDIPPPPQQDTPPPPIQMLSDVADLKLEPDIKTTGQSRAVPQHAPGIKLPAYSDLPSRSLPPLITPLPVLNMQASYLTSPVDVLATLPSEQMLRELLARVLVGGIGRLYFECHSQYGRILWSQNGVLQSVLDRLPPTVFRGVIDELKRLAGLPLVLVNQPEQVEIERMYQQTRVLLRFRFMLNSHGEEATMQVLRGAALKFHQQQQLVKLERDALSIAKQLQNKLNEIRDRAHAEPGLSGAKFEALPALGQLLHHIEAQLDDLGVHPSSDKTNGTNT
jgi:hypothetical protein